MTIETITSNPWFSLTSLAVTTASLVVAFIFYRKSRREKTPCYSVTRQSVIENRTPLLPGLSVQFNGVVQEVITVAKVAFWNHGTGTITRQDIAEAKPLAIVVDEGVDVLNATVLKRTDSANQVQIGEPQKQPTGLTIVPLGFDFLDRGDGALVQVVHNGEERTRVWVEGRIKGACDPMRQSTPTPDQRRVRRMVRMMRSRSFMAVCVLMYLALGVALIVGGICDSSARPAIAVGVPLVIISLLGSLAFLVGRRVPAALNPIDEETPNKSVDSDKK